jgi:hypothetical protein
MAVTQCLLFVGCGDGLLDPNFKPFMTWLREVNAGNEARHYPRSAEGARREPPFGGIPKLDLCRGDSCAHSVIFRSGRALRFGGGFFNGR